MFASVPISVTPNHTKPLLNVNRMKIIRLRRKKLLLKKKNSSLFDN